MKCGVCRIARSLCALGSAEAMRLERQRFRRLEGPDGMRQVVSRIDGATEEPARRDAIMVTLNEPGRIVCAWNRELGGQLRSWLRAVSRL